MTAICWAELAAAGREKGVLPCFTRCAFPRLVFISRSQQARSRVSHANDGDNRRSLQISRRNKCRGPRGLWVLFSAAATALSLNQLGRMDVLRWAVGTLSGSAGLSGITGLTQKVLCQIIKSAVSEIKASAIYFRPGTLVSSKVYVVEPFRTHELLEVGQGGTEKCI